MLSRARNFYVRCRVVPITSGQSDTATYYPLELQTTGTCPTQPSNNDDGLEGDDDDGEEDEPEPIVVRGSAGSKTGGGDTRPAAAGGDTKTKYPTNKNPIHHVRVAYLPYSPKDLILMCMYST